MKFKFALMAVSLIAATYVPSGCKSPEVSRAQRAAQPLPAPVQRKMTNMNMPLTSPIMVRLFKEESLLEVWKQQRDGRFGLIASYDICKWSGKLGPKYMEGDRQAPEGFYTINRSQMNPNSNYYLSFDLGFPNAYDQAHGRTGRHLMVHGSCSSAGCYSMTDKSVAQIYAFGRDAFIGGQRNFQVEAFPFRMTHENMRRYRKDPNYLFWVNLKQGYDAFERTKTPPKIDVCNGRYVFNSPMGCASGAGLRTAFAAEAADNAADSAFSSVKSAFSKTPAPSILNRQEASLVADWSRRRAAGKPVSGEPPSLTRASAEMPNAPDIIAARGSQIYAVRPPVAQMPAPADSGYIEEQQEAASAKALAVPSQKPEQQPDFFKHQAAADFGSI